MTLTQQQRRLARMAERGYVMPRIDADKLAVGRMGVVSYPGDVIGDAKKPINAEVIQVVDGGNMIVKFFGDNWLWITIGTEGVVDAAQLQLKTPLHIDGTKTYATAIGGSRTVFHAKTIGMDEARLEKLMGAYTAKRKAAAAEAEKLRKEEDASLERMKRLIYFETNKRQWADSAGKFSILAAYDGFEPGHVWLVKADLSRVKVPLTKLSEADRKLAVKTARERGDFM